ncbi:unnamed protein product [Leptosia nina]|uniref:glutathione transferase n=1 Tax=Leptosia nina TaxID=320188 RepID=A0AAV1IYW1_9NEOP
MAKKYLCFDLNALAEPTKYMLHYAGQQFEDVQYELKKWPIQSVKDWLPYGQFPLYEEGGKTLNQSFAIARYIASQTNLLPTDAWEQAELDAVVGNLYDFWSKIPPFIREKDLAKREIIKREILESHVNFYFSRLEKELLKNGGHFAKKLSWADFVLLGLVEGVRIFIGVEIQKPYPNVNKLVDELRELPGVKEYLAKRTHLSFL